MSTLDEAARAFLSERRIAVAGVSRHGDTAANAIYKKLRADGREVFAINPNADSVEGDRSFHTLAEIPGGVDALIIGTPPAAAVELVRQCPSAGVRRVWMHRAFGAGSVNDEAVRLCKELGLAVIPGSCPMMFAEPVDVGHRCIKWIQGVFGQRTVPVDERTPSA